MPRMMQMVEANYPELMKVAFIVNGKVQCLRCYISQGIMRLTDNSYVYIPCYTLVIV